ASSGPSRTTLDESPLFLNPPVPAVGDEVPNAPAKAPPQSAPAKSSPENAPALAPSAQIASEPAQVSEQPSVPPASTEEPPAEAPAHDPPAPTIQAEGDPAKSPSGAPVEGGHRLLGPSPNLWPEIVLPAPSEDADAPRIATAPAEGEAMPAAPASELPSVLDAPLEYAPAPSAPVIEESAQDPIALPPDPLRLPSVPELSNDPSAGGVAPRPDPVPAPAPEASRGGASSPPIVAAPPKVDATVARASAGVGPKPTAPPPVTVLPAPVEEPRPLPIDPADLPVELPPLSGPEASLMNLDGLRPGIPDAPPLELPIRSIARSDRTGSTIPASGRTIRRVSFEPAARSNDEPTAVRIPVPPPTSRAVFEAGALAARVGDEVITVLELKKAVSLRRKGMPEGPLDPETSYALAKTVLNDLVDRAIVLQEARRLMKNPKQIELFHAQADKIWAEEELPPLLRQTASANVHELKRKMEERGESLDDHREAFRKEFLFRGFIEHKVGPRLKVELPEMRRYYLDHLREFHRPALITWREIVVDRPAQGEGEPARRKVNEILGRLLQGADFATIARDESDGPNRSSGGAWQTSPGSYVVAEVNQALDVLPIGQISRVIETPTAYHVVRVEARRPAGPLSFSEAQDQIHRILRGEKIRRESEAYLAHLREEAVVTTVFDAPEVVRASAERPSPSPR
ncbi:MAG: peptidyl-prolyl cis-trans isomerase, partial [Isosphaeraceae bacterium]